MSNFYDNSWAADMMASARSKANGKPIANNTRLYDNGDGSYRLRLHNTDIVRYNADGTWTISAGGWTTVTTAQRIREYSPIKLHIESGEWYVWLEPREDDPCPQYVGPPIPAPFIEPNPGPEPEGYPGRYEWYQKNKRYRQCMELLEEYGNADNWKAARKEQYAARREYLRLGAEWVQRNHIPFYDGITVNEEGYALRLRADGPSPAKLRKHEREVKRVKDVINKYVDGFIAELVKGMAMPSNGDCWYCSMRTESGKPMGEEMQTLHSDGTVTIELNVDHLWSHIEERYYVPSLIANALLETGYQPAGAYMWLDMNLTTNMMGGRERGPRSYDTPRRALKKYLQARLVPNAPTE